MIDRPILRSAITFLAVSIALPVIAQEEVQLFEEIIVTASKRAQTLQEIPVAVSVVAADAIRDSQIRDVKDLQFLVPSLRVNQLQTSGNANFFIRGFGNGANNAGLEPSVGVFIDGVYRSRSAAALSDLPNLERVEVLRGPQSTLFGKNASAGVINIITAKPNLDAYEGSVSATFGDYSQVIVQGDFSAPLSDTTAVSLSGSYNQRDGYFTNLTSGSEINELDRTGLRGQFLYAPNDDFELRLIADWDKFDEQCCGVANLVLGPTGLGIAAVGGEVVPNQPFAYQNYYDFDPVNEVENSGISAQFDWGFSNAATLTSITAFRTQDRFDNADIDFTSAQLIAPLAGNLTDTTIDTLTQEFRLAGSTDTIDWMIGAYYFDEEVKTNSSVILGPAMRGYANALTFDFTTMMSAFDRLELLGNLGAVPSIPAGSNFFGSGQGNLELSGMDNQAISIFTQVDFQIGDRTTLTVGANYTEDEKDAFVNIAGTDEFAALELVQVGYESIFLQLTGAPALPPFTEAFPVENATATALSSIQCPAPAPLPPDACNPLLTLIPFQFLPPVVAFPNAVETGNTKDDQTTWTVRLAFDWTDSVNIYASAGTGFKASSWNLSRDSKPFAADIQALENAGLAVDNMRSGTRFARPEDSTVYEFGVKTRWMTGSLNMAVFAQEIEGFQSNLFTGIAFNFINAGKQSVDGLEMELTWRPVDDFMFTLGGTWLDPVYDSFVDGVGVNGPEDLTGTKPAGIPEIAIVTTGQYDFDIGASSSGFVRAEYIFEDEVQVNENVPMSVASREVSTFNASVGIRWENGFEAMLWGRNLTDDEYLQSSFPSVAQPGSYSGYPNQPRTYGLTVRKYFD
jgi:outer membrane receptor protein involved in Fe transport